MFNNLFEFFSGFKMTIAGGVFLAISMILMITNTTFTFDPAWITVMICGYPLFYLAIWRVIGNKGMNKISSELLISIAMFACIWLSFSPGGHENIFAAGEVAFIMAIGAILEDKTVERAKKGIKQLITLMPEQGRIIKNGQEKMIPIALVGKDDILRVLPGETIPVDGEIQLGDTSIDQSIITGESLPVDKTIGDSVFCGTINRFGCIDIKATKIGEDSSIQKLIRLVQDAEANKAPMQHIVDKWASYLVPIALLIAMGTYMIWDITRAVTILVVFCPCALALATPTSIMAAIGQATKHGVIIKSGDALERMGKVDTIAFDKTGTLTHGTLVVSDTIIFDNQINENEFLSLIASIETYSEHPLGKAIVAHAKQRNITVKSMEHFKMIPGKGVGAVINNQEVICGNTSWMKERKVFFTEKVDKSLERFHKQGKAIVLVACDQTCIGLVALSDTLRSTAKSMVQELKQMRIDAVLLTGDHSQTAEYFAGQVDIETVFAELLPVQKVEQIQNLQNKKRIVCMIGDGVNDAPALKASNVGVAMGTMGSDIAIEAADIALMGDDISKIPYLKRLSAATVNLIKFNIILSMAINFAAIILSMLAVLNPLTGALVHNIGSVLVVLNAARLYDRNYT